jgi:hypothetical protein
VIRSGIVVVLLVSACAFRAASADQPRPAVPCWRHAALESGSSLIPGGTWNDTSGQRLSTDGTSIFITAAGAIHAYDSSSGKERWHTTDRGFSAPAFASGSVAALDARGSLRAYDARSGRLRWTLATPGSGSVASTGRGFFVNGHMRDGAFFASITGGRALWIDRLRGEDPGWIAVIHGNTVYVGDNEDGAIIRSSILVFRLGPGGGFDGETDAGEPVEADARGAWIAFASNMGSTTFGVLRLDEARRFGISAKWLYTPNTDVRSALPGFGTAVIGGGFVYGQTHEVDLAAPNTVHAPIYRYRLAPAAGQTPLVMVSDGRWIGGPHSGVLVVERDDGLWLIGAAENAVRPIRAMSYDATATHADVVAFAGALVYAGFSDGRLVALDVRSGRLRFDAPRACPDDIRAISVQPPGVLASCGSSVAAFRMARAS